MVRVDECEIVAMPHRGEAPQQAGREDWIDSLEHG
jgi:hypothetical protein